MILQYTLFCRILIYFKVPYFVRQIGSQKVWIPDKKYFLGHWASSVQDWLERQANVNLFLCDVFF